MSATVESSPLRRSSGSGIGHMASPARLAASAISAASESSLAITPAVRVPSATVCAPVSVATSTSRLGPSASGADQRVGQHQAALGVGVQHLDGLAPVDGDDVRRPLRPAARHVLGDREVADHVHRRAELGDGLDRGQHRRGAAHVGLHRLHRLRRLERQAAGVERDALAREHHGAGRVRVGVLEPDQARRVRRAHAHREDAAEPLLGQVVLVEHLHAQAVRRGHLLGRRGQVGRDQVGGSGVHQVADQRHRVGQDPGPADGVLVGGVHGQLDVAGPAAVVRYFLKE